MRPARDFLFIQLLNTRAKPKRICLVYQMGGGKGIVEKIIGWVYNLIFDTCEEREVPQPLENTGLWHFVPWN